MANVIISRRQAADTGRRFFYTGKPCAHGHISPRYTTSGGCVACLKGMYTPKRNPWTVLLVPFTSSNLWTARDLSKAQRVALRCYLQECIFAFLRAQPELSSVELETAMSEITDRLRFASPDDPRNTD